MKEPNVLWAFWQGVFAVLQGPEETRDGTILWYLTLLVIALTVGVVAVLVAATVLLLSWRGVDLMPAWARSIYDWARGFFGANKE